MRDEQDGHEQAAERGAAGPVQREQGHGDAGTLVGQADEHRSGCVERESARHAAPPESRTVTLLTGDVDESVPRCAPPNHLSDW